MQSGTDAFTKMLSAVFPREVAREKFFRAIQKPEDIFCLRVNSTKIATKALLESVQNENLATEIKEGYLPFSLITPIKGPKKIQDHPALVECDRFAGEALLLGADLFRPGVLQFPMNGKKGDKVNITWKNGTEPLAEGILALDGKAFQGQSRGVSVKVTKARFEGPRFRSWKPAVYHRGLLSDQSIPPLLACHLLSRLFSPDSPVLDFCAAPGNKTAALSELLFQQTNEWVPIISIDKSRNRMQNLYSDIKRLGLQNIHPITEKIERLPNLPEMKQYLNQGKTIIFDPPCSALGHRPQLEFTHTVEEIQYCAYYQKELFKIVDKFAANGAFVMYNTCTLPKEENEDMIAYALSHFDYNLVDLHDIPQSFNQHYPFKRGIAHPQLSSVESNKLLRFYPTEKRGQSYFIAVLQKNA